MKNLEQTTLISVASAGRELSHPDELVADPRLSLAEKRALLAAMASDERTVPEVPTMRRLDNGAIVSLTSILKALEDLDELAERLPQTFAVGRVADQRSAEILTRWRKRPLWQRSKRDDDDEPPPVPLAMRATPAWA